MGELIDGCDGGVTAPFGDVDAVADGLVEVLTRGRDSYRERLLAAGDGMVWPRVVEPL